MKMVKSLLLGSAAGLVAVAGAQAADLPVKAKAVEYVKVCSAYGAGYFYIPGTDTCLKIGGYARFDAYANAVGTFRPDIATTAGAGFDGPGRSGLAFPFRNDDDSDILTRARGVFDMDARTQTDYGTLRSYVRFGGEWNSQAGAGAGPNNALYFERAFIQFAGFTFGYTQSFFDIGVNYMMTTPFAGSNTWTTLMAYTAQFGNGFSATIALEDQANRVTGVQGSTAFAGIAAAANRVWFGSINGFGTSPFVNAYEGIGAGLGYQNWQAGYSMPDIVANLRLDQAWGTVMLSGALHQVNAQVPVVGGGAFPLPGGSSSDQWGWAIGGALILNADMIAKGDSFLLQASYAKGAISYAGMGGNSQGTATAWGNLSVNGQGLLTGAYVPLADAVLLNTPGASDFGLTEAWALMGQFRHYWTPGIRSVVFGGYTNYEVPDNTAVAAVGANMWQVGTDLIWSPVKNLDLGLEVVYSKVSADVPLQVAGALQNNGFTSVIGGSTDIWSGGIRAQRNF